MKFLQILGLAINLKEFYLEDISLVLEQGDYLMVIGPTGAGKTILLESIIGFWMPDRGKVVLEGRDITNLAPEQRHIGIVYQDYALLPHFTVFRNISYGLKKIRNDGQVSEKVRRMAKALRIDHLLHRMPNTLSGGEQQRVALGRALIVKPKLLLMDEPFSALDPQTRKETRRLVAKAIREQNTTVIHISHDLDDAWALANKVAVFKEGMLLQFGFLEEVFNRPRSRFIADFVGTNILQGKIEEDGVGLCTIAFPGFSLKSLDEGKPGQEVSVAIRPEDIIITKTKPSDVSAQNILYSELKDIEKEGTTSVLLLNVHGTELRVLVTKNAVDQLALAVGDRIYAMIKSSSVRIV